MRCVAATLAITVLAGPWLLAGTKAAAQSATPSADAPASSSKKSTRKASQPAKTAAKQAFDAELALDQARKALAAGKAETAAKLAESVLTDDKRDPRNTARALAVRGEVRLGQGRTAEAMADLDNALWVKGGLAGAERELASAARTKAYLQAGLGDPGQRPERTASVAATRSPARKADRPADEAAAAQPSGSASGGTTGIGSFFSNLFGGSTAAKSKSDATAGAGTLPPAPASARVAATSSSEPQRAVGAPAPSPPARKPVAVERAATAAVHTPKATKGSAGKGAYILQLAAVRTPDEAKALAAKVRKLHGNVLARQHFDVHEAVFGNMGRFYRVRIGPFASKVESTALCASLRSSGHDCMVIDK